MPVDGDEVYVEVTSSLECTTNNPATSEIFELNVLQMVLAEVSLAVDNNNVCEGTSVTFTATPVNGGDEPTYIWWLNDILVGSNQPTYTYVPANSDMISVVMVPDPNLPCVGNSQTESLPIIMIVNEVVTPSVSIVASENPVFVGYPVTFTPSPENGGDTPAYQWYVNGNFVSDGTFYTYEPDNGDEIYAIMTSSLECVTSSTATSNTIEMVVSDGIPVIVSNTTSLVQTINQPNGQATDYISLQNGGEGTLVWSAAVEYLGPNAPVVVPEGPAIAPLNLDLATAGHGSGSSPIEKDRETVVLNYDGDNNDGIGLQSGGSFSVAARYPSDMTSPYTGYMLESVDVYINDAPILASLKVWGAGTTTTPGTLLLEQDFSGTGWLTIALTEPIEVSGSDIWVGYTVTHIAGAYPAGCDAGPANANGDWISSDGTSWDHLANLVYSANWNIRANLTGVNYGWLSLDPDGGTIEANDLQDIQVNYDALDLPVNETYTANILISSNDPETPVLTIPVTMALTVGVEEAGKSQIQVYPNPASDVIHIKNMEGVRNISVINSLGQLVMEEQISDQDSKDIGTAKLQSGIYQLQFRYFDGNIDHKTIVISK